MVRIDDDLDNLPAGKRLERLRSLIAQREQELKQLAAKKDALAVEQVKKGKDLEVARRGVQDALEELSLESEAADESEDDDEDVVVESAESSDATGSIDDLLGSPSPVVDASPVGMPYASLDGLAVPKSLYELSDYNLYGDLRRLEQKAYLTSEEQHRIASIRQQASALTAAYESSAVSTIDEKSGNYISRVEQVLQRLDKKSRDLTGDLYDLSSRPDQMYK